MSINEYQINSQKSKIEAILADVKMAKEAYHKQKSLVKKLESLKLIKDAVIVIGQETKCMNRDSRRWMQQVVESFYRKHKILDLLAESVGIETDLYREKYWNLRKYTEKLLKRSIVQRMIKKYENEFDKYI